MRRRRFDRSWWMYSIAISVLLGLVAAGGAALLMSVAVEACR